ncbi:MAG: glycosyltransferase [Desulfovibrionaceae bacterium]
MQKRVIIIPAIKKNAVIPDQLIKKLAGITLMERALNTARAVTSGENIIVLTDSQEISLLCERAGVGFRYNKDFHVGGLDIVHALRHVLEEVAQNFENLLIYRPSCPLLTWVDIDDAWHNFAESDADSLVTVKSVRQRIWEHNNGTLDALLDDDSGTLLYMESKALIILKSTALLSGHIDRTIPYFLNDRALEINSYQDWWICERLLMRRHVVFVVAGYPAIGMGHIYRALMLAHEISEHRITFMCTRKSELAVTSITARDHKTVMQHGEDLAAEVLSLKPDLVINDMLNTERDYMHSLKTAGIRVVNFEDEGPGALLADYVINALYEEKVHDERFCYGPRYFCLRDEFAGAARNVFRPEVRTVLVTFGGTDNTDFTRRTLDVIEPLCRTRGIHIRVVAGPGYVHSEALATHIAQLNNPLVEFTNTTNVMSRMMEGADLAVCSAGRTVYELAHMRVPALVVAHHQREAQHSFARAHNGFAYLGIMSKISDTKLRNVFERMLEAENRQRLFDRQNRFTFSRNKNHVIRIMLELLDSDHTDNNEAVS